MKGGKREGAGRPATGHQPPMTWRPKSPEVRAKFFELGGSKWLNGYLEEQVKISSCATLPAATK